MSARLTLLYQGQISDIDDFDYALPVVGDADANAEYTHEIIDAYMQNFFNKINRSEDDDEQIPTKNVIAECHEYIENILKQYIRNKAGICINCHEALPTISMQQNKIIINNKKISKELSDKVIYKTEAAMITPTKSKEHLRRLWNNEKKLFKLIVPCLALINAEYPTDTFFFEIIPVIPSTARPANFVDGYVIEHPQTRIYTSILETCLILTTIIQVIQDKSTKNLLQEAVAVFKRIKGDTPIQKLQNTWQTLQQNADHLMDCNMNKTSIGINSLGLKQILEKKEGLIRKHMMGKRVDFAGRSVISPDPYLNIDEIGIPEAFALELTYPVTVTSWNYLELAEAVLNGPDVHPGAIMVKNEDGLLQALSSTNYAQRLGVAQCLLRRRIRPGYIGIKVVYRHLQNGDMVLLNRQPTLHKASMMAHKARILKGEKTLRLHYANCKAYNADFDGDEMNIHFPQDEIARSEACNIADVSKQYLAPRDGSVLTGLIQDHIISGVQLTVRGQFLSKECYMQIIYEALAAVQGLGRQEKIIVLPPCMIKPQQLWSGKQAISTIIINILSSQKTKINLISNAKVKEEMWQKEKPRRWKCGIEFENPRQTFMSECEVIIRNGELLCGIFDKAQYGATAFGLIHSVHEIHGSVYGMKMLNAFSRLLQAFHQFHAFSLDVEDLLITAKSEKKRKKIISHCKKIGEHVQRSVIKASDDMSIDEVKAKIELNWNNPKFRARVDRKYKTSLEVYINDINKTCLTGLLKKFPDNNMQLMVQSGAKGSTMNIAQVTGMLGQIELEGKRPPLMMSGRSLPSFSPYDSSPEAGGFITGRFLTGIKPQELFFHCMAGREGLIDTAVKTSTSGYLQRCLVKHLEGVTIDYDGTVRDSDRRIIQFQYGEDGLDIFCSRFLNEKLIPFLVDNKDAILDPQLLENLKTDNEGPRKLIKKIKKWKKKNGSPLQKRRESGFLHFCRENISKNNNKEKVITKSHYRKSLHNQMKRDKASVSLLKKWSEMTDEAKKTYYKRCERCPDPVMSKYRQDFGILSERLENIMDKYLSNHSSKINKSDLRDLLTIKSIKSICQPGEPVGILAAQAIGEPSTQMTLNTFHFAGRGEMNMTLGIPRLREILMFASKNIKTPSMEIPFRIGLPDLKNQTKRVKLELRECFLSNIIEDFVITTKIDRGEKLTYTIMICYLPPKYYEKKYSIDPQDIIKRTEKVFIKNMFKEIEKLFKSNKKLLYFDNDSKKLKDENAMLDQIESEAAENSSEKNKFDLKAHESSDEEQVADDTDAMMMKTISRHRENQGYEDPEEEEEINDITSDKEEADDSASETLKNKMNESNNNNDDDDDHDDDDDDDDKINNKKNTKYANERKCVIDMYPNVTDYDYDEDEFSWCKFTFWVCIPNA
jgi:DNA-directed RNA polymerase I subunit RPA1